MRQTLIAGNWKMQGTLAQAREYLDILLPKLPKQEKSRVLLAVPFTLLAHMSKWAEGTPLQIGAQNMCDQDVGAFTGEIAGVMLQDAGAGFVIIGHSERRRLFHETDALVHKKLVKALSLNLETILCVGESLEERQSGKVEAVLRSQIESALKGFSKEQVVQIKLAYEPIWAIGTGMNATAEIANETHRFCREFLQEMFDRQVAETISILYGGSVKPDNIDELIHQEHVDGVLVGGASLDPHSFLRIIESV